MRDHPRLRIFARLWENAKNEHSAPHEIGWSVAVGVLSGSTPFLGLHIWIALGLATVFRLNRIWAFLGSRISFSPLFAFVAFCEIESGHRLRTGAWVRLSPRDAIAHGKELLGDWVLGTVIVGCALAVVVGTGAYLVARRWQDSNQQRRHVLRPRSSESPPSVPPAPIR
ncbi:MAG: DUF2062 domain-containing protein [Myxococcota bacterium]|nr:DUF2062 domain-containing protein [Myxococcota bacterium]